MVGCRTEIDDPELSTSDQETTEAHSQATIAETETETTESTDVTMGTEEPPSNHTETETTKPPEVSVDPQDPPLLIEVRSLQELLEMKEMIACEDETLVQQYIFGLAGGWAQNKDDLKAFVSLVEKVPYIPLIDGDITWISYMTGHSSDSDEPYGILYVTTHAENGDWVRLEYLLSEKNTEDKIAQEVSANETVSLITAPLITKDAKIAFHIETREPHPTKQGVMINWVANVNGIFTRIAYYTSSSNEVVTSELLEEIEISQIIASTADQ
jgi:hypothetical protein